MGMFTRSNMNPSETAELVFSTAVHIVKRYQETGSLADESLRTDIINLCCNENGWKASWWRLSKLALAADALARSWIATGDSAAVLAGADDPITRAEHLEQLELELIGSGLADT